MALPTAAPERGLHHLRSIDMPIVARGNDPWKGDARIGDARARDTASATGLWPAGMPIHDMTMRRVVDERFDAVQAGTHTAAMPYPGACAAEICGAADALHGPAIAGPTPPDHR